MDTTTINQIIETGGLLLLGLFGFLAYRITIKRKNLVDREIKLLRDCLFYRAVISEYKEELSSHTGENNRYNTFRKSVEADLGYSNSGLSEPAAVCTRLDELKELSQDMSRVADSLKK
ncbi:MAG: hypothetical protein PF447_03795 [Spirochaetaceae bacterium]|nr:hypothetical protein [Spirochaetaceae bacterium]